METGKLIEDTYKDIYDSNKYIRVYENVIIAKGGDGTLIKAIHKYKHLKLPFYGLSAGTVGFLMNDNISLQNITIIDLDLIKAEITYIDYKDIVENIVTKEFEAFNDICIGGDPRLWVEFDIKEKDDMIGEFTGSGVIIASPQGTTAINKNNKGSILPLTSYLWSITGDKTSRDINFIIKPTQTNINFSCRLPVPVLLDGTNAIIDNVKSLIISKGDTVKIIFSDYDKFKMKRKV